MPTPADEHLLNLCNENFAYCNELANRINQLADDIIKLGLIVKEMKENEK